MSVYDEEKLLIKPCFIKMQNSLNANIRSKVQKTKIIKTKVVVGLSLSLSLSFFLSFYLSLSLSHTVLTETMLLSLKKEYK